ncbi:single-stranded DNA-binding replication protein A, large (70 kD) subunit [Cenarchaeum symbiosum A]|uniref:Single-stranded DNA-binding replication protein A, large (70 kD) subunit n=1 Tax=Cenarchaeum symbiosum (strain A) TaxID=414004 RepID=A0RXF4_CENSY|nr:single-stranded DNA-binding replication protein A, large (70 kD) subunit [Cenarchaeum symbiosum A]
MVQRGRVICRLRFGGLYGAKKNFIIARFIRHSMSFTNTEDAKNMRSDVNIEGEIVNKGETRTVNKRSGGTIDVCDAYLKDDRGEIKLTLWAEDINLVKNGDRVKITKGYTNTFKGEVSLGKGKFGQIEVINS